MNKKEFIATIDIDEKNVLSNVYDKIQLAQKINKSIYLSEFYSPQLWRKLNNISHLLNCKIESYGVFKESERRMLCILDKDEKQEEFQYPLELIKIKNKSSFSKLSHSDYLGALMSLGLKREKFGDLIVDEDICYVPICSDIYLYVKDNLCKISNSPCSIEVLDLNNITIPEYKFLEKVVTSTSRRIDCVVASICGISRNLSVDLIKKGNVLLDYQKINNKDKVVSEDSTITIRGYGKFKILQDIGKTKKDRCKISVKKYI